MKIKYAFFLTISLLFASCDSKDENIVDKNQTQIDTKQQIKAQTIYPINLKTLHEDIIKVDKINRGFSFSNTSNKAVLLNFFASWCPPCKAEIPHLNNLQKQYKDDLQIIGVLLEDKDKDEIDQFAKQYNIEYTIAYSKENFKLAKAVGDVKAIPFSILYDKNGTYATHYVGAIPEEMMNIDIQKVVK